MNLAHEINNTVRTDDVIVTEDITFEGMILSDNTLNGLNAAGFRRPSPVQLHAIPIGKCGFDLLVEAKSGTGKTAVFAVIALEMLEMNNNLQVLVLAPTREIAYQVHDVIKMIGCKYKDLSVEVVMGGTSLGEDKNKFSKLSKPQIIVGSPGRLRHIIQDNVISVSKVRLFVMDEADKLMEDSFQADVNFIFSKLPERKQVIANSATYTDPLRKFVTRYMRSPSHIKPNNSSVLLGVKQNITRVDCHENVMKQVSIKHVELKKILENISFKQCLVFCNYQKRAKDLCSSLKRDGWPAEYLAGNQTQNERLTALKNLQEFKCRILVATDLASRGIDAANVDLVINFELPYDVATYLHRIGRAGRYGSYGSTTSIVVKGKEEDDFRKMLTVLGDNVKLSNLWTSDSLKMNVLEEHMATNSNNIQNNIISDKNDDLDPEDMTTLYKYMCKDFSCTHTKDSFKQLVDSFDKFQINSDLNEPQNTINIQPEIENLPENVGINIKYLIDNVFMRDFNKKNSNAIDTSENVLINERYSPVIMNEEKMNRSQDRVNEKILDEGVRLDKKVQREQKKCKQPNSQKLVKQIRENDVVYKPSQNSEVSKCTSRVGIPDNHKKYKGKTYSYDSQLQNKQAEVENYNYVNNFPSDVGNTQKNYCDQNNLKTDYYKNNHSKKRINEKGIRVEQEAYQHNRRNNTTDRKNIYSKIQDDKDSLNSERIQKNLKCHQRKVKSECKDDVNLINTEYEIWRSQLAVISSQIQQTVYMYEMCRK